MVKRFIFTLLLIVIFTKLGSNLNCQPSSMKTIDSLNLELNHSRSADTLRVNILQKISFQYYSIDPMQGIKFGRKALSLAKELNYKRGVALSLNAIGSNYWTLANYSYALKNLMIALDIFTEIGDSVGIGKIQNNIGLLYCLVDFNDKGIKYFQKALNNRINLQDSTAKVMNYVNIAGAYRELKQFKLSVNYYNQALSEASKYGVYQFTNRIYLNLGITYYCMKEYKLAYDCIKRSEKELEQYMANDEYSRAATKSEHASLLLRYASDTNSNKTIIPELRATKEQILLIVRDNLDASMAYFHKIDAQSSLKNSYYNLASMFHELNQNDSAYYYVSKANQLTDVLQKQNDITKLNIIEAERNLVMQRNEIIKEQEKNSISRIITYFAVGFAIILFTALAYVIKVANKNKTLNLSLNEKNTIISQTNFELETLVNELSDKQIEIEDTNDKLHAANAAKDKFFSIISHDLRSPFTGIIGLSELLTTEIDNLSKEEISRISRGILSSAKSTYELLNGLLEWAKSQLSIISFKPQIAEPANICGQIIKSLLPIAKVKGIDINNKIENDISVFCDIDMFSTILRNLIGNSIKFTNSGGNIDIETQIEDKFIQFSIIDSGIGIEKNILDKLFTLNDVITTVGTNEEKGSGFGLLLCKEFVDKHNGKIWATSIMGQGTTFHFTLPTP